MRQLLITLITLFCLTSCSSVQMSNVVVEQKLTQPGKPWHNYTIKAPPPDAHKLRPTYQSTLQQGLTRQLQKIHLMPHKPADIEVSAYVLVRREKRQAIQGYHFGSAGRKIKDNNPADFVVQVGSVVVDLFDPESGKLIWRASSSTEINFALDEAQTKAQIQNGLAAIFGRFPQQPRP